MVFFHFDQRTISAAQHDFGMFLVSATTRRVDEGSPVQI